MDLVADANVVALQKTINRYAGPGGFSKISPDGTVGQFTGQATLKSLAWLTSNSPDHADTAAGLAAKLVTDTGAIDLAQITSSAAGLYQFLAGAADDAGLAIVNPPLVATVVNKIFPVGSAPSNAAASLSNTWAGLPMWAKVGVGVAFGIGAIATAKYVKKRHGGLGGLLGFNGSFIDV